MKAVILNGRNPEDRFKEGKLEETIKEVIDRSGMLTYLSPYVDSALKVTSGLHGFAPTSRYARNGWAESLLGANFALFRDAQSFGASLASGDDRDKVIKKGLVLAPFNFWFRLANQMGSQ